MNIAKLIPIAVQLSMAFIIFSVALHATFRDCTYLLHKPWLLVRSLLAMNVIMPLFAIAVALLFDLNHVVAASLIALALSPLPPILPKKEIKAGGPPSYTLGLIVITALLSIIFVPAATELLNRTFGRNLDVSPSKVATIVATSLLVPLFAGVCVRRWLPSVAQKLARPLSILGTVLLVVAFLPVLIKLWPAIASLVGNFTLVAIAAFVIVGLVVGHLLGGPDPDERTVLALSTATRHPAIAILILHQEEHQATVAAAVILALLVGAIVSAPYAKWRGRSHPQP